MPFGLPMVVAYAHKQDEEMVDCITSTGWESSLEAVLRADLGVVRTWPIEATHATRQISQGANALASYVILIWAPPPGRLLPAMVTLAQAPPGTRPEVPLPATPAATPQAAALALDAGTLTGMADAEWNVERHLMGKPPEVVALYHHFTRLVSACGPFTYSVSKSAITFKGSRRGFAGARLRHRALGGYLDLQRRVDDPRITRSSPYTSRLYVHQFRIETASQLDDEFAGWIREAYQVGGGAHLSGIGTPAMRP